MMNPVRWWLSPTILLVTVMISVALGEFTPDQLIWSSELCNELGYGGEFEFCAELFFCEGDNDEIDDNQRERKLLRSNIRRKEMEHKYYDGLSSTDDMNESYEEGNGTTMMTMGETTAEGEDMNGDANKAKFGWKLSQTASCSWPGPLIRMKRGHKYGLFVHGSGNEEVFTNLHTHGLHVPGHGNGDDVTRKVSGNDVIIYQMDIPAYHMGGTYWYHSHYHGKTCEQVSGGAFGMLIIDDDGEGVGTDDAMVKALLSRDNELLLVATNLAGPWIANGAAGSKIDTYIIEHEAWYRLRVLTVNTDSHQSQQTISFDKDACDVYALAHDGIFLFQVPAATDKYEFVMSVSSRLDVAIQCRQKSKIKINNHVIAIIETESVDNVQSRSPWVGGVKDASWASTRPPYLEDLRDKDVDESFYVKVGETNLNGKGYSPTDPLCAGGSDFTYGTIQEWTLHTSTHPLHIHMYPMQIVSCGDDFEVGEYYDTVMKTTGDCIVRMNFVDIGGRTILHCHIFQHGDQGAMGFVNVVGGPVIDGPRYSKCDNEPCDAPVIPNTCQSD